MTNHCALRTASLLLLLGACGVASEPVRSSEQDTDNASDERDAGKKADPSRSPVEEDPCPPDNPYCEDEPSETPEKPPAEVCPSQEFDLAPAGVNVIVAVDGSGSMTTFWPQIRDAVRDMVQSSHSVRFGVDLFWAEPIQTLEEGLERINVCGQTQHKFLEPGIDRGDQIADLFGAEPPGPGRVILDLTPLADPLNYYLVNQTGLDDPDSTNYLVLISDGNDNCFGNFFAQDQDKKLLYEKLTRELVKKNIRVLPIGFNGASEHLDPSTGFQPVETDFTALNTIAEHGGTGIDTALAADDADALARAIEAVSRRIGNCRFEIPAALDPAQNVNAFDLSFSINGLTVQRDRSGQEGWNFVRGNVSEVEFFGDACQALRSGVKVQAKKNCNAAEVCGTAASRVSAKPRAVQYLLDRSFSMAACSSEGFLDCIPGVTPGLSWWHVAANAIAGAVTAPVNDDVEFGLKYFPDSGDFECNVSDAPAIAPAAGSAFSVIGNVLTELPTGSTPLLAGLERVAQNPGRLADPDVAGALIVVSDGGEACEGVEPAAAAERLGAAARSLRERGVKVFAVRFGAMGEDFPVQDMQLRAIVREGGTASGDPDDPANVPYLEAPDPDALTRALNGISEELASCRLVLGELEEDADKEQVNLYLDGDIVPFDAAQAKQDGWGWLDAARSELELYGDVCTRFKQSRSTSIVIEVGCQPVVLL